MTLTSQPTATPPPTSLSTNREIRLRKQAFVIAIALVVVFALSALNVFRMSNPDHRLPTFFLILWAVVPALFLIFMSFAFWKALAIQKRLARFGVLCEGRARQVDYIRGAHIVSYTYESPDGLSRSGSASVPKKKRPLEGERLQVLALVSSSSVLSSLYPLTLVAVVNEDALTAGS